MADQRVNINIGTTYDGKGMSLAIGGNNKLITATTKTSMAVARLGGAFGQLDKTAGLTIGRMSRLFGALAYGGPIGVAVAGVTLLAEAVSGWFQEQEKARKELEKTEFESAKHSIDQYQESVENLATSLEKAARF
jgi:hypothetical protein